MIIEKPATHDDAQLILKLYELRREEKMRAARDWYLKEFFPQTFEEIAAIYNLNHPNNAYLRMVTSYWDMAASFVVHGALHAEMLLESSGEMMMVWAKIEPFIPQIREVSRMSNFLENIEQVIKSVPWAVDRVRIVRERLPQIREQMVQAEKG